MKKILTVTLACIIFASCTTTAPAGKSTVTGTASYYGKGDGFNGRRTASGVRFNASGLSAAHRSLPFGTKVRVINLKTGKSAVVVINDRGPHVRTGRIIDLSYGAALKIGMVSSGTAKVQLEILR